MSTSAQEHLSDASNGLDDIAITATEPEEFQRPYDHNDLCDSNPEFPVICSFISKFGVNIDLQLNIERLKENIENQETLDDDLIDLHVKLLKKLRRYLNRDQWEKALVRFAYEYSYEDGYEIESLGYLKTRPSIKLSLLRRLLDAQFECDPKFKTSVNAIDADKLRNQPTGRDIKGNTYWHCVDDEGNLRVYRDEPLDYTAWKTVCRNPEDLRRLLSELENSKGEIVGGDPQSEPYNPYPQIFSELFVKVEETSTPPKKPVKKGRGRQRKSSPLQTLKEIDENTIIQESPSEPNPSPSNQIPLSKDSRPGSISPVGSPSVESQVKQTIENILTKVTSSFDFIFRRSSPELPKPNPPKEQLKKATKSKKKREPVELPRRTSSRIQQLQQKKELELEEISKKKRDQVERLAVQQNDSCSRDSIVSDVKSKTRGKKDSQRWRNNKGKKKLSWDKDDSDLSSTSSLTESNDESFMQAINGDDIDENDEDEFACEDEESNGAPVIIKRARTARQSLGADETADPNNSTLIEEDKPCGRCDKSNDPESILLCDMCDDGYHTTCCIPTLMYVPDGDWFCSSCEHKVLIDKLSEVLISVEAVLSTKERERAKREKLRQARKESAKLKPESSNRRRNNIEDDPITLPLPELDRVSFDECLSPSYRERSYKQPKKKFTKVKRSKKRSRLWSDSDEDNYRVNRKSKKSYCRDISDSESEGQDLTESSGSSSESDETNKPKVRKARACVSYNFQEYDELIRSAIYADSDKIDAGLTDHEEEEDQGDSCNVGRGKDMATIEALAYQQENGLIAADAPATHELLESGSTEKPTVPKKKGRKLNDLDADSEIDIATSDESFRALSSTEEEDDEDEEEDATEVSSDDSSIDEIVNIGSRSRTKKKRRRSPSSEYSDFTPRTRRAATKQVSYRESSDEEVDMNKSIKKVKKTILTSDEDTDASWKSAPESDDEIKAEPIPANSNVTSPQPTSGTNNVDLSSVPEIKGDEKVTKKIRLEKRETRPVFVPSTMNESFDEIAAPLHQSLETASVSTSKSQPTKMQSIQAQPLKAQSSKTHPSRSQPSKSLPDSVTQQFLASKPEEPTRQPKIKPQPKAPAATQFGPPNPQTSLVTQQIPVATFSPTQPMRSMRPVQPMHSMPPIPQNHYPQYSQTIYQQYGHPSYYSPHTPTYHNSPQAYGLPNTMPYIVRPPPMTGGLLPPHMVRSPINELNQYCAQSPYPPNMFHSFNMSMPPKNIVPPPPHPPFYSDEEVKPPPQSPSGKQRS